MENINTLNIDSPILAKELLKGKQSQRKQPLVDVRKKPKPIQQQIEEASDKRIKLSPQSTSYLPGDVRSLPKTVPRAYWESSDSWESTSTESSSSEEEAAAEPDNSEAILYQMASLQMRTKLLLLPSFELKAEFNQRITKAAEDIVKDLLKDKE